MTRRTWAIIVVTWITSLIGVGAWTAGQDRQPPSVTRDAPVVFAGEDLGFRVDSEVGGVKRGTLVVRVDGRWVEVQFATKVTPVR